MAHDRVKQLLVELSALDTSTAGHVDLLRRSVRDRSAMVVAKAAQRIAALGVRELLDTLPAAFDRLLRDPVKADPGCRAKLQIVATLEQLGWDGPETFLAARRHVQMEPVWGGQEDTAPALRAQGLAGLVTMGYRDVLFEAVELLSDPMVEARRRAVREVGRVSIDAAELLLRLKARSGDVEPDVVADCLAELMQMSGGRSLAFVASFLNGPIDVAPAAALALGESRQAEAMPLLRRALEHGPRELRPHLMLPLALMRSEESLALLLTVVADQDLLSARAAVDALKLYRTDPAALVRIETALDDHGDATLKRQFADDNS